MISGFSFSYCIVLMYMLLLWPLSTGPHCQVSPFLLATHCTPYKQVQLNCYMLLVVGRLEVLL